MRDGLEIELQLARGSSLFTAHGFNATDAGNVYARARELAERRGDSHQLFMAVYGLWQAAAGSGKHSRLPQIVQPTAAINRRWPQRRITFASAPQRVDDREGRSAARRTAGLGSEAAWA